MSYSYASLDEAWNQSKPKHGRKSARARMTPSPSPSLSPTPSSNGTIVLSDESMSASRSSPSPSMSPSLSPSPSMESFYMDDDRSLSPSPSPPPPLRQNYNHREVGGIVTRGVGSPITALDEDDFDPRGSIEANKTEFVNSLPGRPVQSSQTQQAQQIVGASSSISGVIGGGGGKDEKMMRHILRIQDDVREMLRNGGKGGSECDTEKEYRFPFVETGLFLSVGLFVLLAMNLMLRMGKQHVTYRFNFAD